MSLQSPRFSSGARRARALAAAACFAVLAACATAPKHMHVAYEYRYRVYSSIEKVPSPMIMPLTSTLDLMKFMPPEALNRSMDTLGQDGFMLWRVDAVPGTNDYTFTFRRPIAEGYRPTRAPMEFTGLYQAEAPANPNMFYSFQPRFKGYTVFIFTPGVAQPHELQADWNAKDGALELQEGPWEHTFKLSTDGLKLGHIQEELAGDRLNRHITYLRRIQSGD